ncbi:MAG TPA: CPBP family glutamic-type intramembrane protease [Thermomicrobiaceae bacterium]|nr:CPBP family glutamic-type intramembrane protease [Thermomicrobiaceae bacterium]
MAVSAPKEVEATSAPRVGWRDAVIGFAAIAAGSQIIPRAVLPVAVNHDLAWLPAYAAHAWLVLVPIYWLVVLERGFPLGRLQRGTLRPWAIAWTVLGLLALGIGIALVRSGQPVAVGDAVSPGVTTIIMLLLFQGGLVGLSEEFAFRGLVQSGLNAGLRFGFAFGSREVRLGTLLTATLVALLRAFPLASQSAVLTATEVVIAFGTSLVAGQIYDETDNLWGAVVLHSVYNLGFALPLLLTLH